MDLVQCVRELEERRAQALRVVAECDKKLTAIDVILRPDAASGALARRRGRRGFLEARVIATVNREMHLSEIAAAVGRTPEGIGIVMRRLVSKGLFVKLGHGLYAPAVAPTSNEAREDELTVA